MENKIICGYFFSERTIQHYVQNYWIYSYWLKYNQYESKLIYIYRLIFNFFNFFPWSVFSPSIIRIYWSRFYDWIDVWIWIIVIWWSIFPIHTVRSKIWSGWITRYAFSITACSYTITTICAFGASISWSPSAWWTISFIITAISIKSFDIPS